MNYEQHIPVLQDRDTESLHSSSSVHSNQHLEPVSSGSFIGGGSNVPYNKLLRLQSKESQASLIHDEEDAKNMDDLDLAIAQQEMQNEMNKLVMEHRNSYNPRPVPNLQSMHELDLNQMKSLKLDVDIKPFRQKSERDWTPTLRAKESKELCEKLDNINIVVNELKNYIMNHKSTKVKNEHFLLDKLTEIQDEIEDSEMFVEERIDDKFTQFEHEQKLLTANTDKYQRDIHLLQSELEQTRREMQQILIQNQTQSMQIRELQNIQSLTPRSTPKSPMDHGYAPSMISKLSSIASLSHINELEEKEGIHIDKNEQNLQFEIRRLRKQFQVSQMEEMTKYKQEIYENYYQQMNQFMFKFTQTRTPLPQEQTDIVQETQQQLIRQHKQFELEVDELKKQIDIQRVQYQNMKLQKSDSLTSLESYEERLNDHEEDVRNKLDEIQALNISSLQLQLDLTDIMKNAKKSHYQLFLKEFVAKISRIFFDSNTILSTKLAKTTTFSRMAEEPENEHISEAVMSIIDTIPLTTTVIKVTDILSKSDQNYNVTVHDLKSYIENIENFRLLLVQNGFQNEYEFCQRFAIEVIDAGIIKYRKYKNNQQEYQHYIEHKIKYIHDILISIIARKFGMNLLNSCFNNDVKKFLDLIIFIIKYPPILNQINISGYYRKKHKKHYKHIINKKAFYAQTTSNDNEDNEQFEALIKSYYTLYSNKTLIRNLKKFEKYMRRRSDGDSDSDYSSDSSEEDESEWDEDEDAEQTDIECPQNDQEEMNSLMKFFNEMYEKPAKIFVQCV